MLLLEKKKKKNKFVIVSSYEVTCFIQLIRVEEFDPKDIKKHNAAVLLMDCCRA